MYCALSLILYWYLKCLLLLLASSRNQNTTCGHLASPRPSRKQFRFSGQHFLKTIETNIPCFLRNGTNKNTLNSNTGYGQQLPYTVVNLSSHSLSETKIAVLARSPNYIRSRPKKLPVEDIITAVETSLHNIHNLPARRISV